MEALPLLRLLHLTDSAFPVGGYAYSHGLEWLVAERRVTNEADLSVLLHVFAEQTVRRQWLPAAALAHRARTTGRRQRADEWFDASVSAAPEREAGRAMGRRLIAVAQAAGLSGAEQLADTFRSGPAQYAVVVAATGRALGITEEAVLSALAYSFVAAITQAAVRLGTIGPEAAARLVANQSGALGEAVASVSHARRPRIGAFTPDPEMAAMLQPTLRFRMFAS